MDAHKAEIRDAALPVMLLPSMTLNVWEKLKRKRGWNWFRWWFQVHSLFSLFPFRNLIHTQDRIFHSLNIKGCALGDWQSHCHLRAASTQPQTANLSNWKWSEWLGWILSTYFRKLHWGLFLCSVWWTGYWLERQLLFWIIDVVSSKKALVGLWEEGFAGRAGEE